MNIRLLSITTLLLLAGCASMPSLKRPMDGEADKDAGAFAFCECASPAYRVKAAAQLGWRG